MPRYAKDSAKKPQKRTPKKAVRNPPPRKTAKKTKKTRTYRPTSRDFGQALILTAVLIAASAVISMTVLGIKRGGSQQINPLSAPDVIHDVIHSEVPAPEESLASSPMPQVAAPEKPMAKDSAVISPAPQEKPAPVAAPQKHQPEKAPVNRPAARQTTQTPAVKTPVSVPQTESPVVVKTPVALSQPMNVQFAAPPELPKPEHQGTLVFIIDDAGNNLQELEPFLRFPGPLTIAVLPGLPHSAEAARRIRAAGKEVFLHQPMEALGGQNPGPGAIYADMNTAEILAVLNQNLAEVGPVAGMNNHQGSKITADRQMMETVLTFCREQGIHFLDSRTTAETAVPAAARNLGITIGERNIFIDNEQNRPSMNRFIESGLSRASQNGSAVMIGHTWSPDLAPLLAELHHNFIAQGYTLTTASDLIGR